MGATVPLGERENAGLEFKSADSVAKPFSISREVVAMLNAGGGTIWIGLREDQGRAVEVEGIPDVERERIDLVNHLVEVVEPRLRIPEDVGVEVVESGRARLLRLRVRAAADRGPFAQLKSGGRHFMIRVDHRIRPMTREEIFDRSRDATGETAASFLPERRARVLADDRPGLWIGIEPRPPLELDVQSDSVRAYLLDPERSGNRSAGWNFHLRHAASFGIEPRLHARGIELGKDDYRKVVIWESGCVEFRATMDALRHRIDSEKEIYPLALLEYAVSTARLAHALYADRELTTSPPEIVFVDGALTNVDGWHLPAFAPGTSGYLHPAHGAPEGLDDGSFVLPSPFRFPWNEFHETPDQAGYMLVRAIYQAFHLGEDRIPREYDRVRRRLVFEG